MWPDLHSDLLADAELVFGIFGLAKHQLTLDEIKAETQRDATPNVTSFEQTQDSITFPIVRARITNHEPMTPIKDLKTSLYGKLVTLRGTVVRVSNIKPVCTWLAFECSQCQGVQSVYQPYGKYLEPNKCPGPGCKSRRFNPIR